jgi:hypothetical protein
VGKTTERESAEQGARSSIGVVPLVIYLFEVRAGVRAEIGMILMVHHQRELGIEDSRGTSSNCLAV